MGFETVLISAISFGIFAVASLLAGHFSMVRTPTQRYATLLPLTRAKGVAKLLRDRRRDGNIL